MKAKIFDRVLFCLKEKLKEHNEGNVECTIGGNQMSKRISYPNIDMQRTGRKLKHMIESAGYTPRIIQDYLHLSCVQPIYRWYKGKILPSVDHLFMLSELLNVHMEDLLVKKNAVPVIYDIEQCYAQAAQKRFIAYYKKIYQSVA